jgi:hypothetical protein
MNAAVDICRNGLDALKRILKLDYDAIISGHPNAGDGWLDVDGTGPNLFTGNTDDPHNRAWRS